MGRLPSLRETTVADGQLFWLEQRPAEGGRTTLMGRPAHQPHGVARERTPGSWDLRTRVHAYGGGSFCCGSGCVVFVHDGDRCLWRLDLAGSGAPQRLTNPAERCFADGLIDPLRRRWIGVMEANGRDQLVTVPLDGGEPQQLHPAADFCGYAAISPDGQQLAWVEWQQPHMPWDRSELWLAGLTASGELTARRCVAGSNAEAPQAISVFQPLWIGPEELVVAEDSSGWWNLRRLHTGSGLQERVCVGPLEVHLLLRQVTLRDQPVELSPREFALLCALLMPPGVVRSRQELLRMAWPPFSGGPRSVDTQVLTLRRKLEQAGLGEGGGIETMRQQGYRFSLDNLPETPETSSAPAAPANGAPPLNSLSRN